MSDVLHKAQAKRIPNLFRRLPARAKAAELNLICFTLLIQSAVGLVFAGTMGRWLEGTMQTDMAVRTTALALGFTVVGLAAALTHLAGLQRAPHALRNPAASWLSREVLLVPLFALALALTIAAHGLGNSTPLVILECTVLCLGSAVLWAMTGVYLIKTVPAWNTSATILEFIGSALLLGGAISMALSSLESASGWGPAVMAAAGGMCLGLLLKFAAVRSGIAAEHRACVQLWYPPPATVMSAAQSRVARLVLNGLGIGFVIAGAAKNFQLEVLTGLFIRLAL
jgi:DMSO reductase anchor subunit